MPSHKASPLETSVVGAPEVVPGWGQIQAHHCIPRTGKPEHPISETEQEALMEEVALALHMHPSVAPARASGDPVVCTFGLFQPRGCHPNPLCVLLF